MKMTKVIMAAALACVAIGLTSCGVKDDDENGMIKGSLKNHSIDFTNETEETSRGFSSSISGHAGGTVIISFDNTDNYQSGVMGYMFDLKEDKTTKAKSFGVVGLRNKDNKGNMEYYVSYYKNVTNINADNFGTDLEGDKKAIETEVVKTWKSVTGVAVEEDDTSKIIVYVKPDVEGTNFVYKVYLLKYTDDYKDKFKSDGTPKDLGTATPVATVVTEYTAKTDDEGKNMPQAELAVYANVYAKGLKTRTMEKAATGTLKGTWELIGDYKEGEVELNY